MLFYAKFLRRISLLGIFFFGSLLRHAYATSQKYVEPGQATILGSVPAKYLLPTMLTALESFGLPEARTTRNTESDAQADYLIHSIDTLDKAFQQVSDLLNSSSRREG